MSLYKSHLIARFLIFTMICSWLPGGTAWGVVVVPDPALVPLNQIPVPAPTNAIQFIKDNAAAARLGKALFWDMQVGSDGLTACASCHFKAGVDNRTKNTVHPGPGNIWESVLGANQTLPMDATTFPFHQRVNPDTQSGVARDFHDIVGSQGVRKANFAGIVPGDAVDIAIPVTDTLFTSGGQNVRQVTGRNTPTMINAIFNFNNFWDGRAHFIFNGENPFGPADPNAGIWMNNPAGGGLVKQKVAIELAGLASQAVGPPLNDVEMSAAGRTFPELGRKMLSLVPLGRQLVHPGDSALGFLSRAVRQPNGAITGANGLNVTYSQMIQAAFQNNLWSSPQTVTLNTVSGPKVFSQMEANFPLFWGLAVQAYVATLVSDQTAFDRFLGGDNLALTDQEKLGLAIFLGVGNCVACHGGTEMTNVSHTSVAFVTNAFNAVLDFMFVADGTQVLYDNGFNNTAVTPIADDIGRGGNTPFLNPLSVPANQPIPLNFVKLAELQAVGQLPFATPILDVIFPPDFPVNANGLFKVPGLRNVELTAPYFHNGGARTLDEAVEFYVRGGNFPLVNLSEMDPLIHPGIPLLQGDPVRKAALVAFLKSLTDPRVVAESAPFDHPELFIPEGDPEVLTRIAARDGAGAAAAQLNLTLDQVPPATNTTTLALSGSVQAGMTTPAVSVNGGAAVSATVTGTSWSATVGGLIQGTNTITVSSTETATSIQTTLTASTSLDTTPPTVTINLVTTPTSVSTQTVSGNVEAGGTVQVSVNGGAVAAATVSGTAWSRTVSLVTGANNISVTATDPAGNVSTAVTAIITLNSSVPPVAVNDAAVTTVNTARVISVLANDTAVSNAINPATVIVSTPQSGTAVSNVDGTVTYTPNTGFAGTDFFAYTVKDLLGAVSNPANVSVSVTSPTPTVAETVSVLRAQFRANTPTTGEWIVEGTTTNPASTLITINVGNGTAGPIVGTVVPAAGTWRFRQAGSTVLPDATRTISAVSTPTGASRLAFPVAVR